MAETSGNCAAQGRRELFVRDGMHVLVADKFGHAATGHGCSGAFHVHGHRCSPSIGSVLHLLGLFIAWYHQSGRLGP